MKFCIHCGTQLSDEAQFCTNCGAQTGSFETSGTVKAPDSEGNVKAPDTEGEFVLASWNAPAPRDTAVRREEGPKKEEVPQAKEKKQGCLSYIFLFAKVLLIAVGSVFLLVFFIGFFSDDKPDSPKTEQHQPAKSSVFPEAEELDGADNAESTKDDGIIRLEDMAPEDAIVYMEGLLQRTETELEEELKKGDDANPEKVEMLRFDMELYQKRIKKYKQQLQND